VIIEWFTPTRRSFEWFGETPITIAAIQRGETSAVASVIGPPGPASNSAFDPGDLASLFVSS
jgi:hypothetical protein